MANKLLAEHRLQYRKADSSSNINQAANLLMPSPLVYRELEPRIVFDGAFDATVSEVSSHDSSDGFNAENNSDSAGGSSTETDTNELVEALMAYSGEEKPSTEVVFIDESIEDFEQLISSIDPAFEIILLQTDVDGVEQIAQVLSNRTDIDAIHIISHGNQAELILGTAVLNIDSMNSAYSDELAIIANSLTGDADILIYGCNFGEGDLGQQAALRLAELTGADVAASVDETGSTDLGGDWDLEYATGLLETKMAIDSQGQENWQGLLATETFQQDVNGYTGTQDTYTDELSPNTSRGSQDLVTADAMISGSNSEAQGLIRFDSIFGSGPNQIPLGSTINSAELSVDVISTSDSSAQISLHRMLVDWNEASTWNSLVNGVQTNNAEASSAIDSTIASPNLSGTQVFSGIASTLQAWSYGDTNYGWVIISDDTDGWDFSSSEESVVASRPILSVNYTAPSNSVTVETTVDVADGNTSSIGALNANKGADGFISLREAMMAANNSANADAFTPDEINFNISTSDAGYVDPDAIPANGDEYWTIQMAADGLPDLVDPVNLDATTQPGYSPGNGRPVIDLDGSLTGAGVNGIRLHTDDSIVRGFAVHSFGDEGIEIDGSTGFGDNNTIQNNWVGVDAEGNLAGNAEHAMMITVDATGNKIGGTGTNDGNVIVGAPTGFVGLTIRDNSDNNTVEGNYIGVMPDGVTAGANAIGIEIVRSSDNNTIGGLDAGAGNVISGNTGDGIILDGTTNGTYTTAVTGNKILGNIIGLNAAGTAALGNGDDGIDIKNGATGTIVGGNTAAHRNVISGNTGDGVYLESSGNTIIGNYIGTDVTGTTGPGNGGNGIRATNAGTSNTIGTGNAGEGNLVAFNTGAGIQIEGTTTGASISGNSIHSNTGLGIDLNGDGLTANDAGDVDSGENNLQNFPVLSMVQSTGAYITINGTLNSTASRTFRIEYFSNPTSDASNHGEGRTYLGFEDVITDGSGNIALNTVLNVSVGADEFVTATATDLTTGDTSEFALNVQVNELPVITAGGGPPVYNQQTGANNPFDGFNVGERSSPNLVDIDNDGDLDAFVGDRDGNWEYFENTGSALNAIFAAGVIDPFGLIDAGSSIHPDFVDIDNDGDLDVFVGDFGGDIGYLENTGTASSPSFAARIDNPFGLSNVGARATPSFVDIDGDGDLDAFVGNEAGNIQYFENTGNAASPSLQQV